MLATLKSNLKSVEVRDYSGRQAEDLRHTIEVDFAVGNLHLHDDQLTIICQDGCYILVYELNREKIEPLKFYRS